MAEDFLLTPLELVLGRPLGTDRDALALPEVKPGISALEVIEESLREGLASPPCVVMYSGGRDSSALLAVAVGLARRLGLELPIPFTFRYPGVAEADESQWQEEVIRYLGIEKWERREVGDELDFLGPHAKEVLLRHGNVWPPNAFVMSVAAKAAEGGSVVTGSFGDEMFQPDPQQRRIRAALEKEGLFSGRDLARIGLVVAPRPVRRAVATRRFLKSDHLPPWLSAEVLPSARRAMAGELAEMHLRWDAAIRAAWRNRYTQVVGRVLSLLAADRDARHVAPFGDPRFRVAFAHLGGSGGFRSRTEAMQALFADLLPATLLKRSSKATFGGVFWNRHSLEFARGWDEDGLDRRLVDVGVLRQIWTWDPTARARPDFRSAALFQAAWLAAAGRVTPVSRAQR